MTGRTFFPKKGHSIVQISGSTGYVPRVQETEVGPDGVVCDVLSNDWASAYLDEDDYKIGAAIAGHDVHPDASGHMPLVSDALLSIADARRTGALAPGQLAQAPFISGLSPEATSRALAYLAQRDRDGSPTLDSTGFDLFA